MNKADRIQLSCIWDQPPARLFLLACTKTFPTETPKTRRLPKSDESHFGLFIPSKRLSPVIQKVESKKLLTDFPGGSAFTSVDPAHCH